jgi:hypothetical protein
MKFYWAVENNFMKTSWTNIIETLKLKANEEEWKLESEYI